MPEVGNITERADAGMESVADRLHGIVGHGETLHRDVADRKARARSENAPVTMLAERSVADRVRSQGIAINRNLEFPAEHFESADVIAVFMRKQDPIEFVRCDTALAEAEDKLARAQSAIHEQPAMIGCDQRAVPRASAPEHRETKHFRLLAK